jgi:hypothetical protein
VTYPGNEEAKKAGQSFIRQYMPDAQNGFKQFKDKQWYGCLIKNNMVKIIFHAASHDHAKEVLNNIN